MASKILQNKKMLIILVLILLLVIIIPSGYALFSDEENLEQEVTVGKVKVELKENKEWEENEDEFGITKYTKAVKGVSTEKEDAYVRVRCIPIVEYYVEENTEGEGEWLVAPISQTDIMVAINSENWVQDGDYWYYNKVLKGFEETEEINIDWQVIELPSAISQYPIRTDVRVILEYAQASNNMWKEIFKIEDLPAEVERIQ